MNECAMIAVLCGVQAASAAAHAEESALVAAKKATEANTCAARAAAVSAAQSYNLVSGRLNLYSSQKHVEN